MTTVEIAVVAAAFVGQAIASYVVGSRKGHRKAVLEGAPGSFGESFLRRAESHFRTGHEHAQMLQAHELKIAAINGNILKIEAQHALAQSTMADELRDLRLELKELRAVGSGIREDIASFRGALDLDRRLRAREGRDAP